MKTLEVLFVSIVALQQLKSKTLHDITRQYMIKYGTMSARNVAILPLASIFFPHMSHPSMKENYHSIVTSVSMLRLTTVPYGYISRQSTRKSNVLHVQNAMLGFPEVAA